MQKVIEEDPTLRADVTMEVSEDRFRFIDGAQQEFPVDGLFAKKDVSDLNAKMRLLTMLHEKFSTLGQMESGTTPEGADATVG